MDRVEMNHITQIYQDRNGSSFQALKDISLIWTQGKSIAVMGESGSGKSTLARLMSGLEKPAQGNVMIDGMNTSKWSFREWRRHRANIQAVFQDASGTLNPARSTYRNVEEALCNFTRISARERKNRILSLMELTELSPSLLQVPVRKLSGGEQRRMTLLRSLSIRPKFLILDEVTAGLDLISADAVLRVLENYQHEYACGYLVITHDIQTAKRLTEEIIEIKNGEIIRKAVQL
jgi:ABC-type dipeptide/oligopeptide/nickel transport system ATPase subunit